MNTQTALKRCFTYFNDLNNKPGYQGNSCVYFNGDGPEPIRCAIGCLIPPRFQERASYVFGDLNDLMDEIPELRTVFADIDRDTANEMQGIHDDWARGECQPIGRPAFGDDIDSYPVTREDFLDYLQSMMCFHN